MGQPLAWHTQTSSGRCPLLCSEWAGSELVECLETGGTRRDYSWLTTLGNPWEGTRLELGPGRLEGLSDQRDAYTEGPAWAWAGLEPERGWTHVRLAPMGAGLGGVSGRGSGEKAVKTTGSSTRRAPRARPGPNLPGHETQLSPGGCPSTRQPPEVQSRGADPRLGAPCGGAEEGKTLEAKGLQKKCNPSPDWLCGLSKPLVSQACHPLLGAELPFPADGTGAKEVP